ncbi:MAG: TrmH family RNA methyltransferase [Oscillospiraceae bacterium]
MHITSKENPKIKLCMKLAASKKARKENKMFFIEGARLCSDAIKEMQAGRLEIYGVFASKNSLEKYKDYIDISLFEKDSSRFFTVDEKLCKMVCNTQSEQDIFAVIKMQENMLADNSIKANGKYLVLNNVQDPGNLGTLLRTADAVGIDGVVLSNHCCDLYSPKTLRSTMGSIFRIKTYVCDDFSEVVKLFADKHIKTMAAVVDKDAVSVIDADYSKGCAVVVGNEGNGLTDEHSDLCDEKITIKMHGNINSLNAAVAGAIILWEMNRKGE